MGFQGLDIETMFADAALAAEDTGEKNVGETTTKVKKEVKEQEKREVVKVENKEEIESNIKPKVKQEIINESELKGNIDVEQKPKDKIEPKLEDNNVIFKQDTRDALIKRPINNNTNNNINIDIINKVIKMKKVLENYDQTELNFVVGYFQKEVGEEAELIHEALTIEQRGLEALNKIVIAKDHTAADRAFYLMDLNNNNIEDLYEQVDLLTGELGEVGKVTDVNKIKICRKLENSISSMPEDVFKYIKRLQDFTNIAIFD